MTYIKPVHTVKKVKLIATPGLKHFATHHKIIARKDYHNNFKNNHRHEQSEEESQEYHNFHNNNHRHEQSEEEGQNYHNFHQNNHRQKQSEEESQEEEFKRHVQHAPQRQTIYRRIPKQYQQRYAPNVQNYRAF